MAIISCPGADSASYLTFDFDFVCFASQPIRQKAADYAVAFMETQTQGRFL
jgi:hypothetical protein